MRVRALFFGQLCEIVGDPEQEAELPLGTKMEDAFAFFQQRFPLLAPFRNMTIAARNQEYAPWDTALEENDEIAFLPPVSGGSFSPPDETGHRASGETGAKASEESSAFACGKGRREASGEISDEGGDEICQLLRALIPVAEWMAFVKAAEDGAVAAFEGIVRNHSRGRATLYLEYEAYAPMALAKMREIAAQAREKFAVHRVVIIHRLGRLEIGETSVLIAVSAAHRAAAFDACRYSIDTLKRTVPIWKKEFFAHGAAWAEGEIPRGETQPATVASKR
jgi:molybdopterin synthase catalytic subunit